MRIRSPSQGSANDFREIGVNSFKISRLCRTHNSALSGVDSEAAGLFLGIEEHLQLAAECARNGAAPPAKTIALDGPRLERWFAKTFLNLFVGTHGLFGKSEEIFPGTSANLLPCLFQGEALTAPQGLYMARPVARTYREPPPYLSWAIQYLPATLFRASRKRREGPYNLPVYLSLECRGMQFAFLGNLTQLATPQWLEVCETVLAQPGSPQGMLYHPSGLEIRPGTHGERHGVLQVRIEWPEKQNVNWALMDGGEIRPA